MVSFEDPTRPGTCPAPPGPADRRFSFLGNRTRLVPGWPAQGFLNVGARLSGGFRMSEASSEVEGADGQQHQWCRSLSFSTALSALTIPDCGKVQVPS